MVNQRVMSRPATALAGGPLVISVFDSTRRPREIDLRAFGKDTISFGRGEDNDIVLASPLVSRHHGVFQLRDGQVFVRDVGSRNGFVRNGVMVRECPFRQEDILRIDDDDQGVPEGVLFLPGSSSAHFIWQTFSVPEGEQVDIGRGEDCRIVLDHVGVSKRHAVVYSRDGEVYIADMGSTNGVYVNGRRVERARLLREKDIILITNTKLIYSSGRLYYCIYRGGIGVEALDVSKVVRAEGKPLTICNHVSMSVKPGELVAIVGGSGAGKTTLMNAMNGFAKPTAGRVLINGEDLYQSYDALKQLIGFVPQQEIVHDNLTLFSMLDHAAMLRLPDDMPREERRRRVQNVIDTLELSGRENTLIRKLSGGQKKRASIAVELLSDPNLFFLDEPTSGLDPGTEKSLVALLKKMANSGKTIILVTHSTLNLYECDKIAFMGPGGHLCYYGSEPEAKRFFGVDDLVDVYNMIYTDPEGWKDKYIEELDAPLVSVSGGGKRRTKGRKRLKKNRRSALRQTVVLSSRYFRIMLNDRQRLTLIILQAPVLAMFISLVGDGHQFEYQFITKSLLFSFAISSCWVGILNAIQEVCKEQAILKREYMTGLMTGPYIMSKFIVLGTLSLIQSVLLTGVFCLLMGYPEQGVITGGALELLITTYLTTLAAASMGLFVSSLFTSPDRAMTVAPILLVPQILFTGILFDLEGATKIISWFTISRWTVEGYGTTANMNALAYMTEVAGEMTEIEREASDFFTFTVGHMLKDWGVLLIFLVGFVILSVIALLRLKKR